jgi:hypothetical protein
MSILSEPASKKSTKLLAFTCLLFILAGWSWVFISHTPDEKYLLSQEAKNFIEGEFKSLCTSLQQNCTSPLFTGKSRWIGSISIATSPENLDQYLSRSGWRPHGTDSYSRKIYCKTGFSFSQSSEKGLTVVEVAVVGSKQNNKPCPSRERI